MDVHHNERSDEETVLEDSEDEKMEYGDIQNEETEDEVVTS